MSWNVVSTIVARPNPGGAITSMGRMARAAAIMREHGVSANIGRVFYGRDFGSLVMYAGSENYEKHLTNMGAAMADPAFMALQAEISSMPASEFADGMRVWRNIGKVDPEKYGYTSHRFYMVPAKNVQKALDMLPSVQAMAEPYNLGVNMSVSAFGTPMLMTVNYQASSLADAGKAIDGMSASPEWQQSVTDAGALGTLVGSSLVVPAM